MTYLHLLNKVPHEVCVAVSGGVDSMAILNFLKKSPRRIKALHFNHGTSAADAHEEFIRDFCKNNNIELEVGHIQGDFPKKRSLEDWWREQRYLFFESARENMKVITGHHLDDVVEYWAFSSLKGQSKLIPYKRDYIIRPFILNKKAAIKLWALENDIPFVVDNSNKINKFDRNYIRNIMMPHILRINPGIHKTLKKKILEKFRE
jgi:tRNA(Ile)-lysidine synthase